MKSIFFYCCRKGFRRLVQAAKQQAVWLSLDCVNGKYLWALPTPTTFEKVDQTFIIAWQSIMLNHNLKYKINIIKKGTLYKIPFSVLFILTEHQWLRSYNCHLLCMKDIHYSRLYHLRNNSSHNCFRQR